jgi:hypothetical protein
MKRELRILNKEGLYNFYSSADILIMIKMRTIQWGDMSHAWENEKYLENLKGISLACQGVDEIAISISQK